MGLTEETWRGRRVLVTGHSGFKGAWLTLWLQQLGANVSGLALAAEHPLGAYRSLAPWPELDEYVVDVRDANGVAAALASARPEVVFHLAAQSLVRRGYSDPSGTYAVNVLGTIHVLQAVESSRTARCVVVVTSDKVYRRGDPTRSFVETDPLGGEDPYSASKACAEHVVEAWSHTAEEGVKVATARAGNVFGGGDWAEDRLVPDAWRAKLDGEPLRLRHPGATRPWQYVLDPLAGYLLLAGRLLDGGGAPPAVNFGPSAASATVEEFVEILVSNGLCTGWVPAEGNHPPERLSLALDSSLAAATLGWTPRVDVREGLAATGLWYRAQAQEEDLRSLSCRQIAEYHDRWT